MHTTEIQGLHISYPDQLEFETLIEEAFKKHSYYVDLETTTPFIIDAGANIGTSALYFYKQYPKAKIISIEPNPRNLEYLKKNLSDNDVTNVTIIPKALVGKSGEDHVILYVHPQWGVFSSLKQKGWSQDQEMMPVEVETARLSQIITGPVDILKIDIEGAEEEVLHEAKDSLRFVSHLLLEYHETHKGQVEHMQRYLSDSFKTITVTKDDRKEKNREHQLYLIEASK
jgi:FkbM family methyltransferase